MILPAHLLRSVRGWARIAPGAHPWWAAGTATAALGLPLAATMGAGAPLLAAPATFGALVNLYGRHETYARRWRTQAWTGLGLLLAVLAGAVSAVLPLAGWADVLVPALVVALVAAVAKFVTDAVGTGPPAGLIPVFAAGTLSAEPLRTSDLPAVVAVTLACAGLGIALSVAPGLRRPDGPERLAVARAAVAVLGVRARGGAVDPVARHRATAAVQAAWDVLGPRAAGPLGGWLAHADRVLHAGAPERPLRLLLTALPGRRALPAPPAGPVPVAQPWPRRRVLRALRGAGHLRVPALRVGLACAAAVLVAAALGLGHLYWAAVGAAAVLQSPSAGVTLQRGLQRGAGTLAGVLLAAGLVTLATDDVRLWGLTVLCMFAVEFAMPRNYALGTVAITGLSLLLTRLGTSGTGLGQLVLDRLADTALGVLAAVVVALLVPNRSAARALDGALSDLGAARDPAALRGGLLAVAEARTRLADDGWRVPVPRTAVEDEQEAYRRLGDLLGAGRPDHPGRGERRDAGGR